MSKWTLYILKCNGGSLYTGITTDIEKRLQRHNEGKGAKYTRSKLPVRLVYSKKFRNGSSARKEEARIKRLTRIEKLALVGTCN